MNFQAVRLLSSALVIVTVVPALAQQATRPERAKQIVRERVGANPVNIDRNLSKLDDRTSGATIRASQLTGMNIKNSKGDSLGEIKDLVIDSSGRVRYAAVTYGGFAGFGSKLFAVPFEAFHVNQNPNDPNDTDDYVLTLDVTQEQLDGAEGFDNDHWPNFADQKFIQDLDRRYKINRGERGGIDVKVRTGQATERTRDR